MAAAVPGKKFIPDYSSRLKSKISQKLFKPPKIKNQSKVIQAAWKIKSVENQDRKIPGNKKGRLVCRP